MLSKLQSSWNGRAGTINNVTLSTRRDSLLSVLRIWTCAIMLLDLI